MQGASTPLVTPWGRPCITTIEIVVLRYLWKLLIQKVEKQNFKSKGTMLRIILRTFVNVMPGSSIASPPASGMIFQPLRPPSEGRIEKQISCPDEKDLFRGSDGLSCKIIKAVSKSSKHVTSFSSISYCSISEYWTQKPIQSESIHSTILDVHVLKAERQNFPFRATQVR